MKRSAALVVAATLLLVACGKSVSVEPAPGQALPAPAYGATNSASVADLLTAPAQARPQRGDELLKRSEERRSDEFDLPPR